MRALAAMLNRYRSLGQLVLRVVIGGLFVYHGIDKFDAGISMVEGMFRSWGVPAAGLAAPVVAVVEIVGGLALIAGVATRVASALLSVVMLGALLYVKQDLGIISSEPMPGADLDLAYLAGLVALVLWGPAPGPSTACSVSTRTPRSSTMAWPTTTAPCPPPGADESCDLSAGHDEEAHV